MDLRDLAQQWVFCWKLGKQPGTLVTKQGACLQTRIFPDEICDLYVLHRLLQRIVLKHYDKEIHMDPPLDSGGPRKPQALGSSQPYHVSVHMIHDDLILIWSLAKVCKSRPLAYVILLQHPAKICNQIVSMQSCCRSEAIWWIKKWANWWLEAIHTPSNEMINQYQSMIF